MHHYGYQLEQLENMTPWERDVYVALIVDFLKEKEERMREYKQAAKHKR